MGEPGAHDITLLRHGESVGNQESRWQGQADYSLTEKGRKQAAALVKRWLAEKRSFDRIFSSPLKRAFETAEIIAAGLQAPLESDPIWMERDIGEFAGMTSDEVDRRVPRGGSITPFAPLIGEQGEGDWELFLRAGQALHRILTRTPGKFLVVSHGGLLNQVMYAVVGITPSANPSGPRFRFENTGYAHLVYHARSHRWQILALNDHAHWNGSDSD